MPHSPDDKKRALARLHRIMGQAEALERAIHAGAECRLLLQQIAALRGAAGGLMAEVLESHLRDTFGPRAGSAAASPAGTASDASAEIAAPSDAAAPSVADDMDEITRILRTYLK